MTSYCTACLKLGLRRTHTDECPVRASFFCNSCHNYGHLPSECSDTPVTWYRPRTLEELIPADLRERYDIDTETPIVRWRRPTLDDAEREIPENNTVEIRYRESRKGESVGKEGKDRRIRDFMIANKIKTEHAMSDNIQRLREWAVSQGKKISILQEK
jgi:hypothetical protein